MSPQPSCFYRLTPKGHAALAADPRTDRKVQRPKLRDRWDITDRGRAVLDDTTRHR